MSREESVDAAITRCKDEGFLTEFLENRKEVSKMILGNSITMEEYAQVLAEDARLDGIEIGREEGLTEGIKTGLETGRTESLSIFITDYLEEGFSKEKILTKLMKKFSLSKEDAARFYDQATQAL